MAVAAFLVMISTLLSALFVVHAERVETQHFLTARNERSARLADLAADAIARGDRESLVSAARSFAREEGVLYVTVETDGSTVREHPRVGEALRRELDSSPVPSFSRSHGLASSWLAGGAVYDVTRPIVDRAAPEAADTRPAGTVRMGFSFLPSRTRVNELRWRTVLIAALMILLGGFGTMFLVGTIVTPIQELLAATRRVAQGDHGVHAGVQTTDELGDLARSFNEMTARLAEARERNDSWNRELEDRVREKTREIEATRRHLEDVVENVGASILVADLDGIVLSANGHTMEIFGTKPEWTVGLPLAEFSGSNAYEIDRILGELRRGESGPIVREMRRVVPNAGERSLLVTHTLLRDEAGRPRGIVQITKDVTDIRGMEERLVDTDRLSRMGEMAGEIGHELNNYLMAIGGRADLITLALDRGNFRKARASAEMITDQIAEMRKLTDGLLESARKESSPEEFDLNVLVRNTVDFVRPQNSFDGIEIVLRLAREPLPVYADPQQIRQVVLNLLTNGADSIHTMRKDGGRLEITTDRSHNTVGFSVEDNGTGIDDETKSRVFEPHFTTKAGGHGFGLAVCHRVVTNHAGSIRVTSTHGRGATFFVRLPRRVAKVEPELSGASGGGQLRSS